MTSIAILHPESVNVVRANTSYGNIWWYFKYFFTIPKYLILNMKTSLGLANRLFMISSCYSIARRNNLQLVIFDESMNHHSKIDYNTTLFKNFKFVNKSELLTLINNNSMNIYNEDSLNVFECIPDEKILNLTKNINVCIGFFQNHEYFQDYFTEFYNKLDFSDFELKNVLPKSNEFFIHVRRGDFVQFEHHYLKNIDTYYLKAIQQISTDYINDNKSNSIHLKFNVFTDDPDYVKNYYIPKWRKYVEEMELNVNNNSNELEISFEFNLIENMNEISTLISMTNCLNGSIIPNSTFSWWGNYLNSNPNKVSVMPSRWLNRNMSFKLFPSNTRIIDVDKN
jgi:hypothetical protein